LALLLALGVSLPAAAANQFVKLDAQGQAMARSAEAACVLDDASGLVWEAKRNDSSLRDVNNTYSWLPLSDNNKGRYDEADGGSCTGDIKCDTASYVRAVNDDKLCGFSDWRVPTRDELNGIRVSQSELPKIDIDFFPHTWESVYWASSGRDEQARSVDFGDSFDYINRHSRVKYLRLVRGGK
jgi:hypothetical protein